MTETLCSVGQPFTADARGVRLAVRLTPRADRNAVGTVIRGADGRPALQLRLVAPPVEGAANKALIAFLATSLGLRQTDIRIQSGETGRLKVLHLSGNSAALMEKLGAWIP